MELEVFPTYSESPTLFFREPLNRGFVLGSDLGPIKLSGHLCIPFVRGLGDLPSVSSVSSRDRSIGSDGFVTAERMFYVTRRTKRV